MSSSDHLSLEQCAARCPVACFIALAAVMGIARWRRALAILAMLGLLLLILGVLVLRLPFLRTAHFHHPILASYTCL